MSCGSFLYKTSQGPFLTQNKHSKTLSAESYFFNFLLYTDLTELPLKTRFTVRFVLMPYHPMMMVTVIISFRLLCISVINLTAHYTSVLKYLSSWMIAYCFQLSILIASHNFHVVIKWFFLRGVLKVCYLKGLVSNARCGCCNIWLNFHQCSAQQYSH